MRQILWVATAMVVFVPIAASAAPGAMLVGESANGSVIDVAAGGDLADAPRFATGLSAPRGLCVGPNGDVYVAESTAAQITVITDGGDFTDAAPYAFVGAGSFIPVGLACDDDRLLVLDLQGLVLEVTQGGDILGNPVVHSFGYGTSIGLLVDGTGTFVSTGEVFDVSAGGNFTGLPAFATGGVVGALASFTDLRLGASFATPVIHDWTDGGALGPDTVWATLPANVANDNQVDGLMVVGEQLFALSDNAVYDVTAGGDLTLGVPFATGLLGDLVGFEGTLHHVCSVAADCDDADACNGAETCASNACVPAAAPDCDDEDVCTADGCDAMRGCTNDPIGGCCTADADCTIEEICDVANNTCVPIQAGDDSGDDDGGTDDAASTDGGGNTSGGQASFGEDGGVTGTTDDDGSSDASTDAAADDDVAQGCGCTSGPEREPARWAWLLLVAGLWRRRVPVA